MLIELAIIGSTAYWLNPIQAGDTVIVNTGGWHHIIQSGSANVDQHLLTGESQPVEKR